jgi:F420-non-reducing hydrogenase iron-sulfur subunit
MAQKPKFKITLFHCINSFNEKADLPAMANGKVALKVVHLPCSSMVKDVYLLRALEDGADAVIVLVCPDGACRYLEGNIRAQKRVNWVKGLLKEIDFDSRRILLFRSTVGDASAADNAIIETVSMIKAIGVNSAI